MILEIALGIVLGAILIYLLPIIFVLAMYAFMLAIAVIFLALLGWGGYELYHFIIQDFSYSPSSYDALKLWI